MLLVNYCDEDLQAVADQYTILCYRVIVYHTALMSYGNNESRSCKHRYMITITDHSQAASNHNALHIEQGLGSLCYL